MTRYFEVFISLSAEMAPYLLLGFIAAGLAHVLLPKQLIKKHMGKSGFMQSLKASVIGVPLPLCSCGVIPLARELKNSGSSHSSIAAFMAATPQVGIYSIIATWGLLGAAFALMRVVIAFFSGLLSGSVISAIENKKQKKQPGTDASSSNLSRPPFSVRRMLSYGLIELPDSIRNSLLTGLALAALITLLLPDYHSMITRDSQLLSYLAVILLAIPLYVCSTGSIPIAIALLCSGFSPGATMIFLVAGPATSMVTLMTMKSIVGIRDTLLYTAAVIFIALLSAWIIDSTALSVILPTEHMHLHASSTHWFQWLCLVVLLTGMFYRPLASLWGRCLNKKSGMKLLQSYEIKVDGMSCHKCAAAVTRLIESLPEHREVKVDLDSKSVVFLAPTLDRDSLERVLHKEEFAIVD